MSRKAQKGQALVEFALTVPIFLMFVFGILDLARTLFGFVQVADASRQAVRYGIVKGLDADKYQYIDCAGIQDAAQDVPGLLSLNSSNIDVYWEDATGALIAACGDAVTHHDVKGGDVLVVEVHADLMPLTPVLMMFDDSISIDYTTRRTITEGVAATKEWKKPPPAPTGFNATVDCASSTSNVSFSWNQILPTPDRIEIREVITGRIVLALDGAAANSTSCANCDSIPRTDGYAMYYMVAINGTYPDVLASAPSNDVPVVCTSTPAGPPSIQVLVFDDKDRDGIQQSGPEKGLQEVRIFIYEAGDDNIFSDNDPVHSLVTGADGYARFYSLSDQSYRVDVAESSPAVRNDILTKLNDPTDCILSADANGDGIQEMTCTGGKDGIVGTEDDDLAMTQVEFGFAKPPNN